jgi:hypothetical protein
MLTKFCPLLNSYLPVIGMVEEIHLLLLGKNHMSLTFPVTPTYLPHLVDVVKERPLSLALPA